MSVTISLGRGHNLYNGVNYPSILNVWTLALHRSYPYVIVVSEPNQTPSMYIFSSDALVVNLDDGYIYTTADVKVKLSFLQNYFAPHIAKWSEFNDLGTISGGTKLTSIVSAEGFKNRYCNFVLKDMDGAVVGSIGSVRSLDQKIFIDWDGNTTGLDSITYGNLKYYKVSNKFDIISAIPVWDNAGQKNTANEDIDADGDKTLIGSVPNAIITDDGIYFAVGNSVNFNSGLAIQLTKQPWKIYFNPDTASFEQGEDGPIYCYITYIENGAQVNELISTDGFIAYDGNSQSVSSYINFGGTLMYVPVQTPVGEYTIVAKPQINNEEILGLSASLKLTVTGTATDVEPTALELTSPALVNNVLFLKAGKGYTFFWKTTYSDGLVDVNSSVSIVGGSAQNVFNISNGGRTVVVPSSIESKSYTLQACPIYNDEPYYPVMVTIVVQVDPPEGDRYSNFVRYSPPDGEVIKMYPGETVSVLYKADDINEGGTTIYNLPLLVVDVSPSEAFEFSDNYRAITAKEDAIPGVYTIEFSPAPETTPIAVTTIEILEQEDVAVPKYFYLTSEVDPITMYRGESRNLDFTIAMSDGSTAEASGYNWTLVEGISVEAIRVDGATIKASNSIAYGIHTIYVSPIVDGVSYPDLLLAITINIESTDNFTITLYQNSSEQARIDKTNYLKSVGVLTGKLRDSTSIVSPVINIQMSTVPNFNYVLIPKFSRYYFVVDIVSIRNNIWEISLEVDVLMSFKNAILNCKAFIDRNEKRKNGYIVDNRLLMELGQDIEDIELEETIFTPRPEVDDIIKFGTVVLDIFGSEV